MYDLNDVENVAKELIKRGVDVLDVLLSVLEKEDPHEAIRERINLAEKYLKECHEYLDKGDPVQASEKAYKAAEEVVKALATKFGTAEYNEALREGRWYTYLLSRASKTLTSQLGDWVSDGWNAAYDLSVWGFHEGKLSVDHVKVGIKKIERMLEEAKKIISA
jgi:hypothetical protein